MRWSAPFSFFPASLCREERQEWESKEKKLKTAIGSLEKNRDELRGIIREQRDQLKQFRVLLGEQDGADLTETRPKTIEPSEPKTNALSVEPIVVEEFAKKNDLNLKKKAVLDDDEEQGEEEWRVVQIGAPVKSGKKNSDSKSGEYQFTSVVRRKKDRQDLPEADDCDECRAFYDSLAKVTGMDRSKLVREHTRHRSAHPAVNTPPGYWDVGFD